MSKKTRTGRQLPRPEPGVAAPTVTKVTEPGEIVAMVPYVVGFTPTDSLVVVALLGPRRRFGPCLRLDLAESSDAALAEVGYVLSVITAHGFDTVILVAFCADADRAGSVMQPLRLALGRQGVEVAEALRADGRRWWSYSCHDPSCCSPLGSPYDADSSRVAAEAVLSGLQKAPDRESLRAQFEPVSAEARGAVGDECDRRRGCDEVFEEGPLGDAEFGDLVLRHLAAPDAMTVVDMATLLIAVQRTPLRDAAWGLMTRAGAAAHFRLWRQLMRHAPDHLLAPAGTLTGFAAWLDGQGVHASHAVDRVETVSPGYSMCGLLRELLDATVSPDVWSSFPTQRDATA